MSASFENEYTNQLGKKPEHELKKNVKDAAFMPLIEYTFCLGGHVGPDAVQKFIVDARRAVSDFGTSYQARVVNPISSLWLTATNCITSNFAALVASSSSSRSPILPAMQPGNSPAIHDQPKKKKLLPPSVPLSDILNDGTTIIEASKQLADNFATDKPLEANMSKEAIELQKAMRVMVSRHEFER